MAGTLNMRFGLLILMTLLLVAAGWKNKPAAARSVDFAKEIKPVLAKYCYDCHGSEKQKGDLSLEAFADEAAVLKDRKTWEKVMKNLRNHEMPPSKKPQPAEPQRALVADWIEAKLFNVDCDHPDPGRVTIRRLNRAEYNNTIRDLVGIDFQAADDFPADDVGYGFDNIGDVLSMPPVLLEKYLAAADKIMARAIITDSTPKPTSKRFAATELEGTAPGEAAADGLRRLGREGDVHFEFNFPSDGEYILRARAYGEQAGPDPARLALSLDGREIKRFDVKAVRDAPQVYETRLQVTAGRKKFAAAYLNNYKDLKTTDPKLRGDRNLVIDYLEIVSTSLQPVVLPESHKRILICQPAKGAPEPCAREIIGSFARRAYRRPVTPLELDRLVKLAQTAGDAEKNFERGIQVALTAVLVSPNFLFRGELMPEPDNPASVHPINDFALASRLAYFLWSSMPDEELLAHAAKGQLRKKSVLDQQVRRMIHDPRSQALVENFSGQWLQTRNLARVTPDPKTFPKFNEALRVAMGQETELFFQAILREDRTILDFIDGKFTYVNETLARHYGIPGITGDSFQRVALKDGPRGGILTHASILTLTSNPTRTSPVKRGKWVLDNLLGTPPPPAPPDVPELVEAKKGELTGTLRQRMEQHRAKPACISCHERMDPIGFGFENFDAVGAWRDRDGDLPVDPSGTLPSGKSFKEPGELKLILKAQKEQFARCLTEKLLTYALGRGLEYYDRCAVDKICSELARHDYKFSTLILEITKSVPFQMRRGDGGQVAQGP